MSGKEEVLKATRRDTCNDQAVIEFPETEILEEQNQPRQCDAAGPWNIELLLAKFLGAQYCVAHRVSKSYAEASALS